MTMTEPVYCPICSHGLVERQIGGRLRPHCEHCGYTHFINPVPSVGLLIEMDGGLVLIRRGHPPHKDRWTLPSGFIEADESAEQAAIREAAEETGLQVEIIEMAGINSFPEGPPVSGIIIFYRARPVGGALCAGDDAAEARVFLPDALPVMPFRTHREIMAEWLARQQRAMGDLTQPELPDFHIRRAAPGDAHEIVELLRLIPANAHFSQRDWEDAMLRMRESVMVEVFVAEARLQPPLIIGCIALSPVRTLTEGRGLINDMAVLPTFQRRGVGAALLEAVLRRAARLDLRALMVDPQRANEQARAFYAALGFSDTQIMHIKLK
jgi:8-oxo-dGTP diphosphatase